MRCGGFFTSAIALVICIFLIVPSNCLALRKGTVLIGEGAELVNIEETYRGKSVSCLITETAALPGLTRETKRGLLRWINLSARIKRIIRRTTIRKRKRRLRKLRRQLRAACERALESPSEDPPSPDPLPTETPLPTPADSPTPLPSPDPTPKPTATANPSPSPTPTLRPTPPPFTPPEEADIYVDGQLSSDCLQGNYSISERDCSGSDGNAVNNLVDVLGFRDEAAEQPLLPGMAVFVRGGTYRETPEFNSGRPMFSLQAEGTTDEPIYIGGYPGETVTIDAQGNFTNVLYVDTKHVVLDRLRFTGAGTNGIVIDQSESIILQRSEAFQNNTNFGSSSGGIMVISGNDIVIDGCSSHDNANGIVLSAVGWPSAAEAGRNGCKRCIVRNNHLYDNTNTNNNGNADGLVTRFLQGGIIQNNVIANNPDGGWDGLGTVNTIFEHNLIYDSGPEGNGEAIKVNVRGGGANVIRYNIAFSNERGIYDGWADDKNAGAIGNVYFNNVVVGSEKTGLAIEGKNAVVFNNIAFGNSANDFLLADTSANIVHDYNFWGPRLFSDSTIPGPHSIVGDPLFVDGSAAVPDLHLTAQSNAIGNGLPLAHLSQRVNDNMPRVITTAQDFISQNTLSGLHQARQAAEAWQAMIDWLQNVDSSYYTNYSGITDYDGVPIEPDDPIDMGAYQSVSP